MIEHYLALSHDGKQELLSQTAVRMGVDPVIVEKDLWVSATLGILFAHPETKDRFIFKGGTSLSKVYGAIQRFSEDIDLIMDWRLLGLGGPDSDPWDAQRSRTKQDSFNKALGTKTEKYLRETFVPFLRSQLPAEVDVSVSDSVAQGVVIGYPAVYSSDYVQDGVLLEIGPLASWVPSVWKTIVPEVSRYYPQILGGEAIPVKVTTAERTFWEKVTIAHQIACSKKDIPPRYARHYYDIVMLSRSGVAETALQDVELLRSVAEFKDRFYPSRAARYDLASPGTVRILPGEDRLKELARDYRNMTAMFYGTPPGWPAIVEELRRLEQSINTSEREFSMLSNRLVLFDWLVKQLGASSFQELRSRINRPELEGFTPQHTTRFGPEIEHVLFDRPAAHEGTSESLIDSREILAEMDANIVRHWRQIAAKRSRMGKEIFPTYFQWLSLMGTELYLRAYIAERGRLVASLNGHVERCNAHLKDSKDHVPEFTVADLNHLAFWNATGSGKTLLMHVNLLQVRYYASRFPRQAPQIDQVILVTPNERLSEQHLNEFALSGIQAMRFVSSGSALDMFRGLDTPVQVIEIHKLADETKEKTVNIEEFETRNLVFIDEGHKGTGTGGSDLDSQGAWVRRRDRLSATGFSFEYSATFGQALSDRSALEARYAKSILFEYSYPRFYHDGYGKEYRIMNMPAADNRIQEETQIRTYLFANLVWFFQQAQVYREHHAALEPFRIQRPLLAFVGSSVIKTAGEDLSDVATVVDTLVAFAENRNGAALETITQLLAGTVPLYDQSGASVFEGEFRFLQDRYGVFGTAGAQPVPPATAASALYRDMKLALFHATSGNVSVERLTGSAEADGELILRLGAAEHPFGVITVGNAKKLAEHLQSARDGSLNAHVSDRAISASYFRSINDNDSFITVLIGAKKFIEGWSSWRVSSIGLMRIGQSQGPQVVQLFGRGVRLQGYDFRLKRARELAPQHQPQSIPNDIDYVETLSVFGVKAAYIQKFKEIIEEEEGATEFEIVEIPRKRTHEARYGELAYIDLDTDKTRKQALPVWDLAAPATDAERSAFHVSVTWSVALQAFFSRRTLSAISPDTHLEESWFTNGHIRFLDVDQLHRELVEYKNNERYFNLSISRDAIVSLLESSVSTPWYTLRTPPDTMRFDHAGRIPEWQEIAQVLLRSYVKRYFEYRRAEYENQFLRTRPLTSADGGLVHETVRAYLPKTTGTDDVTDKGLLQAVERLRELVDHDWNATVSHGSEPADAGVTALRAANHVYYPLLHLNHDSEARFVPQGLNDGEVQFVRDLMQWFGSPSGSADSGVPGMEEAFFFRNESRGRGLGFFIADNFYPDFILWLLGPEEQTVVFVDPKGIRNLGGFDHPKLRFHRTIKNIEQQLKATTRSGSAGSRDSHDVKPLRLESFIVSTTPYEKVMWNTHAGPAHRDKAAFEDAHVLFMGDGTYIDKMMTKIGGGEA